jgi:monoamine oxidase
MGDALGKIMSRTDLMAHLLRLARVSAHCGTTGESAQEAIERDALRNSGRRRFMQGTAAAGAVAAAGAMSPMAWAGAAKLRRWVSGGENVAVVGAGMAGLACATELARNGIAARVFEAGQRVGGRMHSVRGTFPGQNAELGAEFIGASHHTMLGYARGLGLTLEDASLQPGARYYHFNGSRYTEAQVAEEFRGFVDSIREDLALLSRPTADGYGQTDLLFDSMSLEDYLDLHEAGGLLRTLVGTAYAGEYGAAPGELSAIGFLRFVQGDKRSKFGAFGAFEEQRLHVVEGNDRIPAGLARQLPRPVEFGRRLIAVRQLSGGRVRLVFDVAGHTLETSHDAVILAVPFTVLRDVELDGTLGLPSWKRYAIDNATMGDASKLLVGFQQPYWFNDHGSNGTGYADRNSLQSTWESNPVRASENGAVLAHQIGGARGRLFDPARVQSEARAFLGDLELALPGAQNAARRGSDGGVIAVGENWTANPLSRGAYSSNQPGYFTRIAQNEAKPVGNLFFAGEHTSSFYEWQGFMEGAAVSGLRAAGETLQLLRGQRSAADSRPRIAMSNARGAAPNAAAGHRAVASGNTGIGAQTPRTAEAAGRFRNR